MNAKGPEYGENQLIYPHAKSKLKLSCCYFPLSCFPFLIVADLQSENGEPSQTYRSPHAEEVGRPEEQTSGGVWGSSIFDQHNHHHRKKREHAGDPKADVGLGNKPVLGTRRQPLFSPFQAV